MLVLFVMLALGVDWPSMVPAIQKTLETQFPREESSGGIFRTADITGEGATEALVIHGSGGASTSWVTLMRMEDGKPVIALFKDRVGKIGPLELIAGASVMHTDGIDMLPTDHALFTYRYHYNGEGAIEGCGGEAYRWNPKTKVFEYNGRLSKRLASDTCRKAPQRNDYGL
jgi:hypothetical protein